MVEKMVEVHRLANQLMQEHGLLEQGWKFELSSTKTAVGDCHHNSKTIRYSMHYLKDTPMVEVRNTILHEIAHAIAGFEAGHNYQWRRIAMQVGAVPERCALPGTVKTTAKYNFVVRCDNPLCATQPKWKRHRLKRNSWAGSRCPDCKQPLNAYKINHKK